MTGFSYQLYSSRKFPPLRDTLAMLAGCGYASVEGYGALYADAGLVGELRQHLSDSGLTMPSGHFSLDMLEGDPARVLAVADSLGVETIYCPHVAADQRPDSGAGWEAFGRRLSEAGKPFRDAGLGFGWHNHDFEFVATGDGALPQAAIFEAAPDLQWEADLAWVVRAGADPAQALADFGDRVTAVHLKDIAPSGQAADEDGWADLGKGTVDWKTLMAALSGTSCRHFVLEHDNPSDDARFARSSIHAAQSL